MNVENKVIVVTGGGGGIGLQLVLQLLAKNARVAAVDINLASMEKIKELAGENASRVSLHQTDISSKDSVAKLAEEVIQQHGQVDGIINNAGIIQKFQPIHEMTFESVDRVLGVNLDGVINICKTFLPLLLERPEAHIVNVSSMGGLFAFPHQGIYGASKAAVKLISECLYSELRDTNIGITVVYPGAIGTDITKNSGANTAQTDRAAEKGKATSPVVAASRIITSIEKKQFIVKIGFDAKLLSVLYRICPRLTILLARKAMMATMGD